MKRKIDKNETNSAFILPPECAEGRHEWEDRGGGMYQCKKCLTIDIKDEEWVDVKDELMWEAIIENEKVIKVILFILGVLSVTVAYLVSMNI